MNADEALALVLASRAFSAWGGSSLGGALTDAIGKIAGIVGGAVSLPVSEVAGLILNPDEELEVDSDRRFFAAALEAIRRRRECVLVYRKPGRMSEERRTVQPLHLVSLDHRWVLIAHDPQRRDVRKFILSRMQALTATGKHFEPPAGFDAHAYLSGSFGLFTGDSPVNVCVRFDAFAAPYIRERRWHMSQRIVELPNGSIEAHLCLNNLIDVQRWLLAWGSHAEAIAPAELRESVAKEVQALSAQYAAPARNTEHRDIR